MSTIRVIREDIRILEYSSYGSFSIEALHMGFFKML